MAKERDRKPHRPSRQPAERVVGDPEVRLVPLARQPRPYVRRLLKSTVFWT